MYRITHDFKDIVSVKALLLAWREFLPGKRHKRDVELFSFRLMGELSVLSRELHDHTYRHGPYQAFRINDPKPRDIHKASVRDRVVHHALYRALYPVFDRLFISDSFSCRVGKGTHRARDRFRSFGRRVSKNNTLSCYVLKCDIRKFFASIDHQILKNIFARYIPDSNTHRLVSHVIDSFSPGLPLGNLTSQLLVNIYMNEFDQFVKHVLREKYYIRYADDFMFLSPDRKYLEELLPKIEEFLWTHLRLKLHPHKVSIETLSSGVDFLGWVHFPNHRVLRTTTRRRMLRSLAGDPSEAAVESYRGMLSHGNAHRLSLLLPADSMDP